MKRQGFRNYPLSKVFHLIEPGPVVLVTTAAGATANVMTMSCYMMLGADPPLIGCGIGRWNFSFAALKKHRECVISIPTAAMMRTVVRIGNRSGRDMDKFATYRLTPLSASMVKAPLIAECCANLECRVVSMALVNAYNLVVVRVVRAWVDGRKGRRRMFHANGDGTFVVDGDLVNLKREMTKWKSFIR
jgi:flavin reductase (DIM6/NTAB) family NADH-FMN oxidoreductase RutF